MRDRFLLLSLVLAVGLLSACKTTSPMAEEDVAAFQGNIKDFITERYGRGWGGGKIIKPGVVDWVASSHSVKRPYNDLKTFCQTKGGTFEHHGASKPVIPGMGWANDIIKKPIIASPEYFGACKCTGGSQGDWTVMLTPRKYQKGDRSKEEMVIIRIQDVTKQE